MSMRSWRQSTGRPSRKHSPKYIREWLNQRKDRDMSRFRLTLLVAAAGLLLMPLNLAQAEDTAELAKALKDAKVTLQDGLKASERDGKPISAKFEIEHNALQ